MDMKRFSFFLNICRLKNKTNSEKNESNNTPSRQVIKLAPYLQRRKRTLKVIQQTCNLHVGSFLLLGQVTRLVHKTRGQSSPAKRQMDPNAYKIDW